MDKTKLRDADIRKVADVDAWIAAYGHSQSHAAHSMRDYLDAHPMMAASKRRAIEKWLMNYDRTMVGEGRQGGDAQASKPAAGPPAATTERSLAKWAIGIALATAISQVVEWVVMDY
ncbi:hypothetical protein [Caldimonas sp. KR1-144]|uniref:hypothetical protein n=1 Tax=Caldimonas sp. KR1-144 TaxID=3400911 RepID=UPI003C0988E8